ncbi:MAG: hypothetical protein K5770_02675 [Lachnospiraceae bacterium]|nr:hypothetical protein [Lachnospiraceae bacterium]
MITDGEKRIYEFYDNLPSLEKMKKKTETAERIRKMAEDPGNKEDEDMTEDDFSPDLPEDDPKN